MPSRSRGCQWCRMPSKRTRGHCVRWISPTLGRCTGRVARPCATARTTSPATTWCSRAGSGERCPAAHLSGTQQPRRSRIAALDATGAAETGGDAPRLRVAADDTEILRHRDIADLTAAERAHLAELIAALHPRPATRPALRLRPSRRGRVDPRRTVRHMLAAGGEPVRPQASPQGHPAAPNSAAARCIRLDEPVRGRAAALRARRRQHQPAPPRCSRWAPA